MQEEPHDPYLGLFTIKAYNSMHTDAIQVKTTINGVPVDMELDTEASVSLIPKRIWREKLNAVLVEPPGLGLRTYIGEPLKAAGPGQCASNL